MDGLAARRDELVEIMRAAFRIPQIESGLRRDFIGCCRAV